MDDVAIDEVESLLAPAERGRIEVEVAVAEEGSCLISAI